jgi:hypothetical protein
MRVSNSHQHAPVTMPKGVEANEREMQQGCAKATANHCLKHIIMKNSVC